jgi:hypothetical protein
VYGDQPDGGTDLLPWSNYLPYSGHLASAAHRIRPYAFVPSYQGIPLPGILNGTFL